MSDKQAMLADLKIDRDAAPQDRGQPIKWFMGVALVGGLGFAAWLFGVPGVSLGSLAAQNSVVAVTTAVARAPKTPAAGPSVLDATGYVVARRQATVSSKATGKVVAVLIEEGMEVEEGQLLASLDDSIPQAQLLLANSQQKAARAALEEIDVQIRQAQLDLDRTRGLAERNLASRADLDRDGLSVEALIARLARAQQEIVVAERAADVQQQQVTDMQIRAPFAGIVIAKAAQPGEMISPVSAGGGFTRTGICTIVDMASLEVEVDVNEAYINRVSAEQPVAVTLNAYPDHNFAAKVIAIIPAADRNKATVRVRVGFVERDARVLPDMGVRVAFLDESRMQPPSDVQTPPGVMLPERAVGGVDAERFVFVVANDRAERRRVVIGGSDGAQVRVLTGIVAGDRVVNPLTDELLAALGDGTRVDLQ